jgi:hypothetical protein
MEEARYWAGPVAEPSDRRSGLIAFTILDLRSGTTAGFAHGLVAAYIGFTIGFGALVVRWAVQHVSIASPGRRRHQRRRRRACNR